MESVGVDGVGWNDTVGLLVEEKGATEGEEDTEREQVKKIVKRSSGQFCNKWDVINKKPIS